MSVWRRRVDELLFEGETVEAEVEVGPAHVAVTSHRVLAFTPTQDGKDFRPVDRPNVAGVERRGVDRLDLRETATKAGVAGLLLAGIGAVFDPGAFVPEPDLSGVEDAGGVGGIGDVLGLAQGMLGLLQSIDDVLLAGGALLVLVAAALFAVQVALRRTKVAIDVSGAEPVLLPNQADDAALERLRAAIAPPETPAEGSAEDPAQESAEEPSEDPTAGSTDAGGTDAGTTDPPTTAATTDREE